MSFGALLAHHLAHATEAIGGSPRRLVLLDPPPVVPAALSDPDRASSALLAATTLLSFFASTMKLSLTQDEYEQTMVELSSLPDDAHAAYITGLTLSSDTPAARLLERVLRNQRRLHALRENRYAMHELVQSVAPFSADQPVIDMFLVFASERLTFYLAEFPGLITDNMEPYGEPSVALTLQGGHEEVVSRCAANLEAQFTIALERFLDVSPAARVGTRASETTTRAQTNPIGMADSRGLSITRSSDYFHERQVAGNEVSNRLTMDVPHQSIIAKPTLVGMSYIHPNGGALMRDLQDVVTQGADSIVQVPATRWTLDAPAAAYSAPVMAAARHGGFVAGIQNFDHVQFQILSLEASAMDPQQRLLLEGGHRARCFSVAASKQGTYARKENVGVFVGIELQDFQAILPTVPVGQSVYAATAAMLSVACGRLSYVFGFQGPCIASPTACSSALTALHVASSALLLAECESALAAGVNALLLPSSSLNAANAGMTSPHGRSYTFDTRANGYARSEACGVVALAIGYSMAAQEIASSAVRNDGRSASLTAPNGQAQKRLINATVVTLRKNEYVMHEAHGTGTPLGDPIEVGGLVEPLLTDRGGLIAIGSGKANIGHGEPAAGMGGVMKLTLGLQTGKDVPNAQLRELNPHVNTRISGLRCTIPIHSQESRVESSSKLTGGVSAFGYSGTIAHAVLRHASHATHHASPSTSPTFMYRSRAFMWRHPPPLAKHHTSCAGATTSPSASPQPCIAFELCLTSAGSIRHLIVQPQDVQCLPKLADDHVELTVQAAGLNFRDVLNILNLDPTRTMQPLGLECASVASSVGSHVEHICTGDPIYGLASGCLASVGRVGALLQVRMPQLLSFEQACTLPILYTTIQLAGECIQPRVRQRILIHSTTGGVGLVALELAHLSGALVSASVGRPSKVAHAYATGVTSVATSRDGTIFVLGTAKCLTGHRLHAVLSALTKAFVPTSLVVMTEMSCYAEVGKNNIWSDSRMSAAVTRSPFRLVAADYQSVGWAHSRFCELTTKAGVSVQPLPITAFAFETSDMIYAFEGA